MLTRRKVNSKRETVRLINLPFKKTLAAITIFSICMLIFGLTFLAGGLQKSYATVSTSQETSGGTVLATLDSPLNVSILSPRQNVTYTLARINLTFTVSGLYSWAGYSYDGQTNVTSLQNTTLTNVALGSHYVTVYANDSLGVMTSSSKMYFTVSQLNVLEIAPLGIIQGLTEWLPVSSTAHLKIAQQLIGIEATPLLDVTLHIGTLLVVVFYFRKDIIEILTSLVHLDFKSESGRLIPVIVIATIPTAIIGVLYAEFLEASFQNYLIFGVTFLFGATWLYTSRIEKENVETISPLIAAIMGIAQGLASFPGLSRSGSTISTGLVLGLKREKAFKFSFLLSIPAIIGDTGFEAYHSRGLFAAQYISSTAILVGVALSAIFGYVAIRLVSSLVRSKRFHYFAFYTWALGITLIVLTLTGILTI